MINLADFLEEAGALSLELIWFPLLLWTCIATVIYLSLRGFQRFNPRFQYNLRLALVGSVPVSMFLSLGLKHWPESSTALSVSLPEFIIVDNPLAVSNSTIPATSAPSSIAWSDPLLWIGLITLVLLAISIGKLSKLGWSYYRIASFTRNLNIYSLSDFYTSRSGDHRVPSKLAHKTRLAFSDKASIPFTFGWIRPTIVIPIPLRETPEKLHMAIRHELMHIKRSDFLINTLIKVIRSLFWFHPLIHRVDEDLNGYREITCDSEVLADPSISSRRYAQLLLELARQKKFSSPGIISLSAQKSNLKKRIKIMKNSQNNPLPAAVSTISSLVLLIFISAVIGCSQLRSVNQSSLVQSAGISWDDSRISIFLNQPNANLNANQQQPSHNEKQSSENLSHTPVSALDQARSEAQENERNDSQSDPLPKLSKDFQRCVTYPEAARKAGIEGLVILDFVVNEEGWAENITVRRSVPDFIDNEAKRCLELSAFEPATRNGEPVRAEVSLPIVFRLSGGDREQSYQADVDSLLEETHLQNAIKPMYVIGYGSVDNPGSNLPNIQLAPLNKNGNNE